MLNIARNENRASQADPSPALLGERMAFVVGAPRCGTTSLASYLRSHPDVCFSLVKEPHFFSMYDLRSVPNEELRSRVQTDYLTRFFPHRGTSRLLAEGSVTYLYAAEQMKPILRLWPDPKFVISLRDPMAMLPSLHQRLLYLGDETEADFAKAWALAPLRAQGKRVPRSCVDVRWLRYDEIGRLGKYLQQFLDAVGRERCLILLFEDFVADPGGVYQRLLDFLDLPDDGRRDFSPRRSGKGYRSAMLQRLLKRPPRPIRSVAAGEHFRLRVTGASPRGPDPLPLRALFALRKRLLRWNSIPAPRALLSAAMSREIHDALADDVALLSRLIDRDLSHWLVPSAAAPVVTA
jgi:hypothetical protein